MFQLFHITQDEKTEIDSDNIYGDDTIQIIKEKIVEKHNKGRSEKKSCLLYTSPSPRDS